MSAPLPAPLPPPAMPPPSAPTAAPPSAPMPASFAALRILSLRSRSGPPISPATRLHSATTDCGGTPLAVVDCPVGAEADGAGVVGACATLESVVESDADGAPPLESIELVRFATTMPVTTATTAAITSPIDVIFHTLVLSSAMALSSLRPRKQMPCQRVSLAGPRRLRRGARRLKGRQRRRALHDEDDQRLGAVAQRQLVTRHAGGPNTGAPPQRPGHAHIAAKD